MSSWTRFSDFHTSISCECIHDKSFTLYHSIEGIVNGVLQEPLYADDQALFAEYEEKLMDKLRLWKKDFEWIVSKY